MENLSNEADTGTTNGVSGGSSKRDKQADFVRLAPKRVNNAIKMIQLVGNLANPNYEYDQRQSAKIIKALENEVAKVKEKFSGRSESDGGFTL